MSLSPLLLFFSFVSLIRFYCNVTYLSILFSFSCTCTIFAHVFLCYFYIYFSFFAFIIDFLYILVLYFHYIVALHFARLQKNIHLFRYILSVRYYFLFSIHVSYKRMFYKIFFLFKFVLK